VKELKKDPKLKYVYMLPEELRDDPEAVKKYEQAHKWNIIWVIVAIITFYVWLTYPMQFLLKRFYH
jgi:cell division protein FtsW (lipid II flippase)